MPDKGSITHDTEESVSGQHPEAEERVYFVAPSDESGEIRNTIRLPAFPLACWKIEDICFDFASVFLLPQAQNALKKLKETLDNEARWGQKPVVTLFGHADPIDDDSFNKKLSEDRARIVFGVLVQRPGEWKEIFEQRKQIKALQKNLIDVENDKYGLGSPSGSFDGKTEQAVLAYMNELYPFPPLQDSDFLFEGSSAYQGCGEFNPLLVFSKNQWKELNQKGRKDERDAENRPNRRVIAYLWLRDKLPDKSRWPCKKAKDGLSPCKNRFWSDGDKRRSPQDVAREWDRFAPSPASPPAASAAGVWTYAPASDTFACRHYHRLASYSPCEFTKPPSQKWQILITAFQENYLSKFHDRYTMGCAFHFQFLIHMTIEKDWESGNWKFKEAEIVDVNTRIEPDYEKKDATVVRTNYLDERKILRLQNRKMSGTIDFIDSLFMEGDLDANLKNYVKQPNALYYELDWPAVGAPNAIIAWKINTNLKVAKWDEWDTMKKKWIHATKDLTSISENWYSADDVFISELSVGHLVPLSEGRVIFFRKDLDTRNYWVKIQYDTKRL